MGTTLAKHQCTVLAFSFADIVWDMANSNHTWHLLHWHLNSGFHSAILSSVCSFFVCGMIKPSRKRSIVSSIEWTLCQCHYQQIIFQLF